MKNNNTKKLAACAVMVALGAVLSMIKVLQMPFGGSITLLSMLPCAMISIMYGLKWGFAASFVESVVQSAFEIGTFVVPVPVIDEGVDSVRRGGVDPPFDDLRVVVHFVAP